MGRILPEDPCRHALGVQFVEHIVKIVKLNDFFGFPRGRSIDKIPNTVEPLRFDFEVL